MEFGERRRESRAIDLVPLINIVFLLLIFFLLTALVTPPLTALTEDMLTIRPAPLASIDGATARHQLKQPFMCTSMVRSHSCSSISRRPFGIGVPALLTSTSIAARRSRTSSTTSRARR